MSAAHQYTDMEDRPFGVPPDTVLDIPVPPSVNKTRRINKAALPLVEKWEKQADLRLMASGQFRRAQKVSGPYELTIVFSRQHCKIDPDNAIKSAVDYLRRIELITNDSPKYAARYVIEWGNAPEGCRLILRPCEGRAA